MLAKLYIYHIFDITDSINVIRLKKKLKKLKVRPLRLKHYTPAYLNFPVPPLEMRGTPWILNPKRINLGGKESRLDGNINVGTQFKFYSLGSVTIRYEAALEGKDYGEIFQKAGLISDNKIYSRKTENLIGRIRELIEKEMEIKTYKRFFEDYNILWIQDKFDLKNFQVVKHSIARFLRNETMPLSEYEQNEACRHKFSYTANDLTVIDWDRAVTISPERDDDVWDVLEYVNLQLLELRYYDSELDKKLDEIYALVKKRRLSLIEFYRTPQLLKKTLKIFIDFAEVEERVNSFLNLTGDEYLSRVYQAAAMRLNVKNMQKELKERLIDTRDLYEILSHDVSAIRSEVLEIIIILLIAFEIIFALV